MQLDVTSDSSLRSAVSSVEAILSETGSSLWCVVNNAAALVFADAEWQTKRLVSRQFDVNVIGALEVSKAFLPMLRKTEGRIVNMMSFCTDCPLPTLSVYTATKVRNVVDRVTGFPPG